MRCPFFVQSQHSGASEDNERMSLYSLESLQPVGEQTCQIANEGKEREMPQIPSETDAFQTHDDHACSRANDEQAATCASAVSQQVPKVTILAEVLHDARSIGRGDVVHAHSAGHQRYVIYHEERMPMMPLTA